MGSHGRLSNNELEDELPFTKASLRNSIPEEAFRRSYVKSLFHLMVDIIIFAASWYGIVLANQNLEIHWMIFLWPMYWWYQGLNGTALWVLAHECGHGGFSDSQKLNDVVGFFVHSFLLTPYFSWQITHAKHHRRVNHMSEGESWVPSIIGSNPNYEKFSKTHVGAILRVIIVWLFGWYLYLIFNFTGSPKNVGQSHFSPYSRGLFHPNQRHLVWLSNVGFFGMFALVVAAAWNFGLISTFMVYGIPVIITNIYLVSITFLHHTHADVPHFDSPKWNWLLGAIMTIDRSMGKWADKKLHHITDSHVAHHLFPDMPFYGAKLATEYIAKTLGEHYKHSSSTSYLAYWAEFYKTMKDTPGVQQLKGEPVWKFVK